MSGKLGNAPAAPQAPNGKWYDRVIDTLTGIFTPILPPLTAAGMIKAVLAVLVAFKLVSNTSSTYQVINFMGDATFYFLPILLANSAAKKLGCNPYLAMMLGGILLHPNFVNMVAASKESGEAITIFMLPIYNASYSSSVIPIILQGMVGAGHNEEGQEHANDSGHQPRSQRAQTVDHGSQTRIWP